MSKLSLTEATMLALQGKLPIKENKTIKRTKKLKKEDIDINVDEKTNVSVMDNSTIVDTENATIIVDKKEDIDSVEIPVDSDDTIIPEDLPETDNIDDNTILPDDDMPIMEPAPETDIVDDIDLPLDSASTTIDDETKEENKIIEGKEQVSKGQVPDEAYAIAGYICGMYNGVPTITREQFDEAFEEAKSKIISEDFDDEDLEAEVRGILSFEGWGTNFETGDLETEPTDIEENKKTESVEIEVSDDGQEIEVTTDNGEEVEVKDETPEENDENTDELEPETDIENNDEIFEENKKIQETGEWDNNDEEMQNWLSAMKIDMTKLAKNIGAKLISVEGFDKYQGPYATLETKNHGTIEIWYDTENSDTDFATYIVDLGDTYISGKIAELSEILKEQDISKYKIKKENKKLQEDIEAAPFRNMIIASIEDDIDDASTVIERLAKSMSDDDCKWYCETYELVEVLDNPTNGRYYKDLWGNIRDISGQIVGDDSDLEEAKHRKIESLKKIEKRIVKNKKLETTTRQFNNSNKKIERNIVTKCDLKSFNEALTKTLLKTNTKLESVELLKAVQINDTLKMEAKLNMANNTNKIVCLEMKQNETNNKFTKYNLKKENKNNNLNLTMLTYKNKNNILECRYINKI